MVKMKLWSKSPILVQFTIGKHGRCTNNVAHFLGEGSTPLFRSILVCILREMLRFNAGEQNTNFDLDL